MKNAVIRMDFKVRIASNAAIKRGAMTNGCRDHLSGSSIIVVPRGAAG
jgi:hypothetical protein